MNQPIQLHQFGQRSFERSPLASLDSAPSGPVTSLYAHVPFCFHKCHYCDFYSFVDNRDRQGDFADALIRELRANARSIALGGSRPALRTIFVGGGTPTLLAPEHWSNILNALHESFDVLPSCEFTVESNPETTTEDVLRVLKRGGVNRISIGAQSFNRDHLRTLERHHEPANVERALRRAREAGIGRRSIDLIFAIPGQTLDDLKRDVDQALALGDLVQHVSLYNLMYEPNTALTQRMRTGDVDPVDEETEIAMYEHIADTLAREGFSSYEISNFAKAGEACLHNLAYWNQEQWLAVGPSASAHVVGRRWKNVPHLTQWMQSINAGDGLPHVTDLEPPDERRALAERLMTGIRLTRGYDACGALEEASRLGVRANLDGALGQLVRDGVIAVDGDTWRLTRKGILLADEAGARFIEAVMD